MANFLVTGGAGFIGSHLCRRLLAEDHAVRVFDNLSTGKRENLREVAGQVELVEGDLREGEKLEAAVDGCEYILHHAAVASVKTSVDQPLFEQEINVVGTLRLLEAARRRGVRRLVFAASAAAYGNDPQVPKREDMRPSPASPYAISKVAGEYYCRVYSELFELETVCLRYFNVFGPRQDPSSPYSGVISIFASRMQQGQAPTIFGDGEQSRDFVYVEDVVEANMRACDIRRPSGQIYNIGRGESVTVRQLVDGLNRVLGLSLEAQFGPPRAGDVRHSLAAIERAQKELGYAPSVPFEEGLRRTVEWMGGCS